jgi:predicted metal-dependent enzyme (double-stranded beta helix superfamily)
MMQRNSSTSPDGPSFKGILERLSRLDWARRADAHAAAEIEFSSVDVPALLEELRQSSRDLIQLERSVEKTTHYKWFLREASDSSFELWLHEYKPRQLRRTGHATVAHNHRFWLTSTILRGGFTDTRYARSPTRSCALIEPIQSRSLKVGDTLLIDPEGIHSLSDLRDGTISMVVQSSPVRSYSEVFEGGRVRRYSDLEAKLAELRESL